MAICLQLGFRYVESFILLILFDLTFKINMEPLSHSRQLLQLQALESPPNTIRSKGITPWHFKELSKKRTPQKQAFVHKETKANILRRDHLRQIKSNSWMLQTGFPVKSIGDFSQKQNQTKRTVKQLYKRLRLCKDFIQTSCADHSMFSTKRTKFFKFRNQNMRNKENQIQHEWTGWRQTAASILGDRNQRTQTESQQTYKSAERRKLSIYF